MKPAIGTVLSVEEVTPAVRRLVFGGPDMARFATPPGALGPYLKFRLKGRSGRDLVRTYSIRRYDGGRAEMAVDIVLHGVDGAGSLFALSAKPGDRIALGGPGHIPAEPAGAYLIAGDLTALPAIAHILENLPPGPTVRAIVEVPDRAEEQPITAQPGVRLTWLHRRPDEPSGLPDALREEAAGFGADLLVWAGAEAAIARAIRRHARTTLGLPAERCQVLNYWKQGQAEGGFSYVD